MFVVICTVDFCIYVSMTCSLSCCLCDTLRPMDPWNVCMYVDAGHQAAARKNVRKGLSHVSVTCYTSVWL